MKTVLNIFQVNRRYFTIEIKKYRMSTSIPKPVEEPEISERFVLEDEDDYSSEGKSEINNKLRRRRDRGDQ